VSTCLISEDALPLPAPQGVSCKSLLVLHEGDFVDPVKANAVPDIESGIALVETWHGRIK